VTGTRNKEQEQGRKRGTRNWEQEQRTKNCGRRRGLVESNFRHRFTNGRAGTGCEPVVFIQGPRDKVGYGKDLLVRMRAGENYYRECDATSIVYYCIHKLAMSQGLMIRRRMGRLAPFCRLFFFLRTRLWRARHSGGSPMVPRCCHRP